MDNFIYSLNATLPIFLMILLGKVLIKLKIIDLPFTKVVDRFVFVVALPVLLFKDLTANDLSKDFNGGYVLFCFVVTLVSISAIWFFTSIFMINKGNRAHLSRLPTGAVPRSWVWLLSTICTTAPVWRP